MQPGQVTIGSPKMREMTQFVLGGDGYSVVCFLRMAKEKLLKTLDAYRRSSKSGALRRSYLRAFGPRMIYRTTKSENMETTKAQVIGVLKRLG